MSAFRNSFKPILEATFLRSRKYHNHLTSKGASRAWRITPRNLLFGEIYLSLSHLKPGHTSLSSEQPTKYLREKISDRPLIRCRWMQRDIETSVRAALGGNAEGIGQHGYCSLVTLVLWGSYISSDWQKQGPPTGWNHFPCALVIATQRLAFSLSGFQCGSAVTIFLLSWLNGTPSGLASEVWLWRNVKSYFIFNTAFMAYVFLCNSHLMTCICSNICFSFGAKNIYKQVFHPLSGLLLDGEPLIVTSSFLLKCYI